MGDVKTEIENRRKELTSRLEELERKREKGLLSSEEVTEYKKIIKELQKLDSPKYQKRVIKKREGEKGKYVGNVGLGVAIALALLGGVIGVNKLIDRAYKRKIAEVKVKQEIIQAPKVERKEEKEVKIVGPLKPIKKPKKKKDISKLITDITKKVAEGVTKKVKEVEDLIKPEKEVKPLVYLQEIKQLPSYHSLLALYGVKELKGAKLSAKYGNAYFLATLLDKLESIRTRQNKYVKTLNKLVRENDKLLVQLAREGVSFIDRKKIKAYEEEQKPISFEELDRIVKLDETITPMLKFLWTIPLNKNDFKVFFPLAYEKIADKFEVFKKDEKYKESIKEMERFYSAQEKEKEKWFEIFDTDRSKIGGVYKEIFDIAINQAADILDYALKYKKIRVSQLEFLGELKVALYFDRKLRDLVGTKRPEKIEEMDKAIDVIFSELKTNESLEGKLDLVNPALGLIYGVKERADLTDRIEKRIERKVRAIEKYVTENNIFLSKEYSKFIVGVVNEANAIIADAFKVFYEPQSTDMGTKINADEIGRAKVMVENIRLLYPIAQIARLPIYDENIKQIAKMYDQLREVKIIAKEADKINEKYESVPLKKLQELKSKVNAQKK